jgi:hypothetical protein
MTREIYKDEEPTPDPEPKDGSYVSPDLDDDAQEWKEVQKIIEENKGNGDNN